MNLLCFYVIALILHLTFTVSMLSGSLKSGHLLDLIVMVEVSHWWWAIKFQIGMFCKLYSKDTLIPLNKEQETEIRKMK